MASALPETGKFLQTVLLIPITGDMFKDIKVVNAVSKPLEDFEKALKALKPEIPYSLITEPVTRRGPKEAKPAPAPPPPPAPNPDEPPLPLDSAPLSPEEQQIEREAAEIENATAAVTGKPPWAAAAAK